MNKLLLTCLVLFLISGCMEHQGQFSDRYGKIHTMPQRECSLISDRLGIGLIVIQYNNQHNTVKVDGVTDGLVITNMLVGSPADLANVPVGIVMVRINGKPLKTMNDYTNELQSSKSLDIEFVGNNGSGNFQLAPVRFRTFANGCTYQFKYK